MISFIIFLYDPVPVLVKGIPVRIHAVPDPHPFSWVLILVATMSFIIHKNYGTCCV